MPNGMGKNVNLNKGVTPRATPLFIKYYGTKI
jgi:hypothetical protein